MTKINRLFPVYSRLSRDFFARVRDLKLTNHKDTGSTSVQTIIDSLERVLFPSIIGPNTITSMDLVEEKWDLNSIYEKITNVINKSDFKRTSRLGGL